MNILILFSDQQHKYAVGKINSQFITPNLDALADDGVLFTNGYSPNPVCGPYRGCLMTGQYTSRCGVYDNGLPLPDGTVTMAEKMNRCGYDTCFVGKWHLGGIGNDPIPRRLQGGFHHFIGYQCYNGFETRAPYNNDVWFYDEENHKHVYNRHRTDVTTDLIIENIERVNSKKRPFFLAASYQAPHYPEQPSERYAALYDGVVFDKSPDYQEIEPYTPTYSPYSPRPFELCPDYQRYGGCMDEYQRLYAGMVSQIDAGVGRIVSKLKELNIYDDTFIVYTSDHGDMQGSHGLKNKCVPYEKSAGVPFIARMPGGRKGENSDALVSGVDIFPTVLEIAGGKQDDLSLDGKSFLSFMKGSASPNEYIISEFVVGNAPWRMIRTPQYKLTVNFKTNEPVSLYDMFSDPWEMKNLKDYPKFKPMMQRLTEIIIRDTSSVK